jgi:hypothetical protein
MKKCVMASIVTFAGLMAIGEAAAGRSGDLLAQVDHLVYATPDMNAGIDTLERLLGVRATVGGQHPGLGTRNALIALGPSSYIEIIGPDPDQAKPNGQRRFGIDDLKAPTLVTWVAKGSLLERFAADARLHGVDLGEVLSGSRKRPDGVMLSWRYTDRLGNIAPSRAHGGEGRFVARLARRASRRATSSEHARSAWTRSPIATRSGASAHCNHQQSQGTRGTPKLMLLAKVAKRPASERALRFIGRTSLCPESDRFERPFRPS